MDIKDEKLRLLLGQVGKRAKAIEKMLAGGAISMDRYDLVELLRFAGTPLMPNVIKDMMSPRVTDDVGEHSRIYCYIPGNFDIGQIEIKGFTLVSNNELAALKQMALGQYPTAQPKSD